MDKQMTPVNDEVHYGNLIISLDFELFWGVHDVLTKESYGDNIYGAHEAVPAILNVFEEHEIHATWAVVGMMGLNNMQEFNAHIPEKVPTYTNKQLSPYDYVIREQIRNNEYDLYFSPELIRVIDQSSGQEMASHTFSHYYCLENGQSLDTFIADAETFHNVIRPKHIRVKSIVFPRNQINRHYLTACQELGFITYRGNEKGWMYRMKQNDRRHLLKRAIRFLDTYINLSGHQTYPRPQATDHLPINLPGSRQLKPVSQFLRKLERHRLNRILKAMTNAAKRGEIYHLWWHPHNFGVRLEENIHFLKQILRHYQQLKVSYGFQSVHMGELAAQIMMENAKQTNEWEDAYQ